MLVGLEREGCRVHRGCCLWDRADLVLGPGRAPACPERRLPRGCAVRAVGAEASLRHWRSLETRLSYKQLDIGNETVPGDLREPSWRVTLTPSCAPNPLLQTAPSLRRRKPLIREKAALPRLRSPFQSRVRREAFPSGPHPCSPSLLPGSYSSFGVSTYFNLPSLKFRSANICFVPTVRP